MTKASKGANVEFTGDAARYAGAAAVSDPADKYISVREAAALLRLSEISIRRKLWKRELTRFKAGGRTLVKESEVLGLIREV